MGIIDWLFGRKKKAQEPVTAPVPASNRKIVHETNVKQENVPDDYAERLRQFKEYEAQELQRRRNEARQSDKAALDRQNHYQQPQVSSYIVGQRTKVVGETTTYISGTLREYHAPPEPDKNRRCCDNCMFYRASPVLGNTGICNNMECYKHGSVVAGSNLNCESDENAFSYLVSET